MVPKRRLLPIYSCKECPYLGKEVIVGDSSIGRNGKYRTFCTHFTGRTITIKHGEKETPEHYVFPDWCLLKEVRV